MAEGDFTAANGPMRIRVEGLSRTLRQLSRAGADAQEMRNLMHSLGNIIVNAANIPTKSGRLERTVRAGKGKTKAVVRAGGARAPYAGVRHYGWPARNIEPAPFLTDAIQSQRARILSELDAGIAELLRSTDLT